MQERTRFVFYSQPPFFFWYRSFPRNLYMCIYCVLVTCHVGDYVSLTAFIIYMHIYDLHA